MKFTKFEDLDVWQEARVLAVAIRTFTGRAMEKKDWGWADQIGRSALSIMANIAEGVDAQTKPEFIQFLSYAKRSAAETRPHLYAGFDRQYVTESELSRTAETTKKIGAQIAKLMKYLQSLS